MSSWIEVETSNGHAVLLDVDDWNRLRPLLAAVVRLQSLRTRDSVRVVLRSYHPPHTVSLIRALFGLDALFRGSGTLDMRRSNVTGAAQTA